MKKTLLRFIPVALLLAVVATVLLATPVFAKMATSDEIRQEIANIEQAQADLKAKREELKKQYDSNRNDIVSIVAQKDGIDQEIICITEELVNNNELIALQSLLIAENQEELEKASQNLELLRKKYKERIRAMEEGGTVSYWAVLFEANSFSDLLDRINMVQEIAAADTKRMELLDKAVKEVEKAKLELDEKKKELDAEREDQQKLLAEQENLRKEAEKVLAKLIVKEEEWSKLLEEAEDAADALIDKLAAKAEELTEAEKRELALKDENLQNGRPTYVDKNGITWALPIDYKRLSSVYGYRTHPVTGQKNKKHNGVDLTATIGTPVYATRSGKVSYVGYQAGGAGNYVNITHDNGFLSTYMHLDSYIVKSGEYVTIGQLIGYAGNTGGSTGPHLHFGIKKNGAWVNPADYLKLPTYYK